MNVELGEVIAKRELYALGDEARKVAVLVGKPQPAPGAASFYCPFQIRGAGHERVRYARGVDPVQAMESCLQMIGIEISVLKSEFGVELRWSETPDDPRCGFPALKS